METFVYWAMVVWFCLAAVGAIVIIGEQRKPMTNGGAVISVAITVLLVLGLSYVRG